MDAHKGNSPFAVLEISENASDAQIKKAYRRLALRYHPDRNLNEEAEKKFKQIQVCYQLLKTPSSRDTIRKILQLRRSQGTGHGFETGYKPYGRNSEDHDFDQGFTTVARYGWRDGLRNLWYEFLLGISITFRIERVPVKMLFFLPVMLIAHTINNDGEQLAVSQVVLAVLQAFIGAWIADIFLQIGMKHDRWLLRAMVNKYLTYILFLIVFMLFFWIWLHGTNLGIQTRSFIIDMFDFDLDKLWSLSLLLLLVGTSAWIVFCFMFDKYHPIWESITVCLITAGIEYWVIF